MPEIPVTSVSLLRAISGHPESERWYEFARTYEPYLRKFVESHFPTIEADDVLQETVLALMKRLPGYRYLPDENGHFRNYLAGIAKFKALDILRKRSRETAKHGAFKEDPTARMPPAEDKAWQQDALETALAQLLADESIEPRTREIFRAVAVEHAKPEDVARRFGVTRNNVDQIKNRMINRLAALAHALTDV